jgi:hypothetical protein
VQQHLCADGDVLGIGASVGQPKDLVADLEPVAGILGAKGLDDAAELDAERLGGLRGHRVEAAALDNVHAVDAEGGDLDDGLAWGGGGLGGFGVDEEGVSFAFSALDVCVIGSVAVHVLFDVGDEKKDL